MSAEANGDDFTTFFDQDRRLIGSLSEYAIFALTVSGRIANWNEGARRTFGYEAHEVVGEPYAIIFTSEDVAAGRPEAELATARTTGKAVVDGWHVRRGGDRFWCTDTVESLLDGSGRLIGFTKIVRDASEHYGTLESLRQSEERLRLTIEGVTDYAIVSMDRSGIIELWNAGAEAIFGYRETDVVGRHLSTIYPLEATERGVPENELALARRDGRAIDESWHVRADGRRFFLSGQMTRLAPALDGTQRGFVKIARDVTARKLADETIKRQAFSDELTQLPNRAFFSESLRRSLAHAKRHPDRAFAVIFLDLDRFKIVNDSLGHTTADGLLVHVARTLERCVRPEDIVARMGGDEFTILLSDLENDASASRVAERIHVALQHPIVLDGREVFTTASMGIAIGKPDYDSVEHILRDADTAMYEAKARGRSQHVVFDAAMHARAVGVLDLQMDLRRAIARHEFFVEYQPIVELAQECIVGFEALVRWRHPTRGVLQPCDFLAEAESIGLVIPLDHWVLHEACRQLKLWHVRFGDETLSVSVNLSSKHFTDESLANELREALERNGLLPPCLKIEITETVLMENVAATTKTIESIGALGIELYIDDFGTGYSSLSYLTRLPLRVLKVDRSFVEAICWNRQSIEIARTIVALAHNLGLKALAEGIETEAQLAALRSLGCELGQGFLFSHAVGRDAATELIARDRDRGR